MENPSLEEWVKLFKITERFKEVSPWQWIASEYIFAVVNPQDGEIGYCSILGNGEDEFGLGIFLGEKGYERYLSIISSEPGVDDYFDSIMTPLLSLLFADRQDMQKQDLEIIRSLGLKFRGRNSWPQFRSQRPGYAPWFLEKEEALFLTIALEQSLMIADRVRNSNLDLYEKVDEDRILTRYYSNGEWREEWRQPEMSQQRTSKSEETTADIVNEAELILIRDSSGKPQGSWELDIFIFPVPIGPLPSRPYFPLCFLTVERQQGIIIDTQMIEPWATVSQQRDVIVQILRKAEQLPRNIHVGSPRVAGILEPITRSLGIDLHMGAIPMLEECKQSLDDYLSE